MKPTHKLAETTTPDGRPLTLTEHDGSFCIRLDGEILMHSKTAGSELTLGEVGCERLPPAAEARILIGGLGLGFTLKSVLGRLGPGGHVDVAELLSDVIEWNQTHLAALNGSYLEDPRVRVRAEDVVATLERARPGTYDAIVLDIDNGPTAMVQKSNVRLYDRRGLKLLKTAVKLEGRIAIWSAGRDDKFVARLQLSGFEVQAIEAKVHPNAKRATHTIYLADPMPRGGKG